MFVLASSLSDLNWPKELCNDRRSEWISLQIKLTTFSESDAEHLMTALMRFGDLIACAFPVLMDFERSDSSGEFVDKVSSSLFTHWEKSCDLKLNSLKCGQAWWNFELDQQLGISYAWIGLWSQTSSARFDRIVGHSRAQLEIICWLLNAIGRTVLSVLWMRSTHNLSTRRSAILMDTVYSSSVSSRSAWQSLGKPDCGRYRRLH